MHVRRNAILQFATVLVLGCDSSVQAVEQTPASQPDALPSSAVAPAMSEYVAVGRVDLEAVVDGVAEGSIATAADLEAQLAVETVAHVDLDADGRRDELRVVERREEKRTVFEVRAVPSAKVKAAANAELELEVAPVVAELELEAKADTGAAILRASYSASFVATAKLDVAASVERTFTGVSVSAEGRMEVDAGANAFLSWSFQATRPRYVATVFVVEHRAAAEPDPCWPPGHCKHGFWKATGEPKPGHRDDDERGGHGPGHGDKPGKDHDDAGKGKSKPASGKPDDAGKPSKGAPKSSSDEPKSSDKPKPASDKPKSDNGKGKGKPDADKDKGSKGKAK